MSVNEFESASKRQRLSDQEKVGDCPTLMREDDIAVAQSLHSSSNIHSALQSSMPVLQLNEGDQNHSNLSGSKLPNMSGSQHEQEKNLPLVVQVSVTRQI